MVLQTASVTLLPPLSLSSCGSSSGGDEGGGDGMDDGLQRLESSSGAAKREAVKSVQTGGMTDGYERRFDRHRRRRRHQGLVGEEKRFRRLRTRYNLVYMFATFGDWVQGAYLYALYREHGFSMRSIGFIFVLGYASSASLGTLVASWGDKYGHKINCVLYGFAYALVCVVSSRRADVFSLYFARILGGICYSLLFSSFEAWVIAECDRKEIHRTNLARLFASATFFNALSAVIAGIIGNAVVDAFSSRKSGVFSGNNSRTLPRLRTADEARVERPLPELRIKTSLFVTEKDVNEFAPAFDVATGALVLCGCLCASLWVNNRTKQHRGDYYEDGGVNDENCYNNDAKDNVNDEEKELSAEIRSIRTKTRKRVRRDGGIIESFKIVATRPELLSLGTMNSLYEAALHAFVFVWTPALEKRKDADQTVSGFVPHGVVFSLFMTCKVLGSMTYAIISRKRNTSVDVDSISRTRKSLRYVFLAATISFFWTVVFKESYFVALFAFSAFEFGLGVYWPAMAVLRGELVPNSLRATVTSVFRVPLNVLVLMLLTAAGRASERALLLCCASMMLLCFVLSVNEG